MTLSCDTLTISSVTETDAGTYRCSAQNTVETEVISDTVKLKYCSSKFSKASYN